MTGIPAAVQWRQRQEPPGAEETTMHHVRTPKAADAPPRRQRRVDPYLLDEVTFTLSDIRRARGLCDPATRQ